MLQARLKLTLSAKQLITKPGLRCPKTSYIWPFDAADQEIIKRQDGMSDSNLRRLNEHHSSMLSHSTDLLQNLKSPSSTSAEQ